MKSKFLFKGLVLMAFFGLLIIAGCKKDNKSTTTTTTTTTQPDNATAQDNAEADNISNDAASVTNQAITAKTKSTAWKCATITKSDTTVNAVAYTKWTIDFGGYADSSLWLVCGCNSLARSGQIILYHRGKGYFTTGFYDSITFNNYYVHSRKVEGYHVSKNIGNYTWLIDANIKITRPNGKFHSWSSYRQNLLTTVTDTTNGVTTDFVYQITDQTGRVTTGTNTKGTTYTIQITKPLMVHLDCKWIESGILKITIPKLSFYVDFGDNVCDALAVASDTIAGKVYTITVTM